MVVATNAKSPTGCGRAFCLDKESGGDLLSHAKSILSSARVRFTVLFGMGRRGSKPLWPPDITGSSCDATTQKEEVKLWLV